MNTNNPFGQDPDAQSRAEKLIKQYRSESIQGDIEFLDSNYSQIIGMDVCNLIEIVQEKVNDVLEIAEMDLRIDMNHKLYDHLWKVDTLLRQICQKVNNDLFISIENLVFYLKEEGDIK